MSGYLKSESEQKKREKRHKEIVSLWYKSGLSYRRFAEKYGGTLHFSARSLARWVKKYYYLFFNSIDELNREIEKRSHEAYKKERKKKKKKDFKETFVEAGFDDTPSFDGVHSFEEVKDGEDIVSFSTSELEFDESGLLNKNSENEILHCAKPKGVTIEREAFLEWLEKRGLGNILNDMIKNWNGSDERVLKYVIFQYVQGVITRRYGG